MKLLNERHRVSIPLPDGRIAEAVVRERGIDARVRGRGFLLRRFDPASLSLRDGATERTLRFRRRTGGVPPLAFVALPIAGGLIRRIIAKKRRT